ncbi:hypothetical protein ABTY20_34845, partial [Streptomyces sp. NPDC126497]
MAWRDRLRRRATGPSAGGRSGASDEGVDRGADGAPGPAVPDAPGPAVPGDWDGGWRRAAAPQLTVSHAPLGVSDGLSFRAGLAAWQNPSFDSGLGHAVLPDAPAGLVRGVTHPAVPRATGTGGGPLLLRALRTETEGDGPRDGTPGTVRPDTARTGGTAPATPVARRTRPSGPAPSGPASGPAPSASGASRSMSSDPARSGSGASGPVPSGAEPSGPASSGPGTSRGGSGGTRAAGPGPGADTAVARATDGTDGGPGSARRNRGLTSTTPPAVLSPSSPAVQRAVTPGTTPVVAPSDSARPSAAPPIPLVRRVAVVPGATTGGAGGRPAPGVPSSSSSSRTPSAGHDADSGPASGPSARRAGRPEAPRADGAGASRPV